MVGRNVSDRRPHRPISLLNRISSGSINKVALSYYMDLFDFTDLRLDVAFRRLCAKLYLKAETQQVDRILVEFSRRYWETNPGVVFGSAGKFSSTHPRGLDATHPFLGVVHSVSYSLLLLNTDLHVAELTSRMSRNQFVKNTLDAIQSQIRPGGPGRPSTPDLTHDDGSSIRIGSDGSDIGGSTLRTRDKRSGSLNSWNSISRDLINIPDPAPGNGVPTVQFNESTTSIQESKLRNHSSTSIVFNRTFEAEMTGLLKVSTRRRSNYRCLSCLLGHVHSGKSTTNTATCESSVCTRETIDLFA